MAGAGLGWNCGPSTRASGLQTRTNVGTDIGTADAARALNEVPRSNEAGALSLTAGGFAHSVSFNAPYPPRPEPRPSPVAPRATLGRGHA